MKSLFDSLHDSGDILSTPRSSWVPEAPPCLDGIQDLYVNFETNGLRWYHGDLPIALAIHCAKGSWYLPWGHHGGGNLDEATVYRFAQTELKNKRLTNVNMKFDLHMSRGWGEKLGGGGLDFEDMNCEVSDVAHYAALLDDHRHRFRVDELIPDYLGETPMPRLDESRMESYHAGEAAPRSMYGVEVVARLKEVMWPELDKQDLQRVRALEDKVIYAVVEMEKNGAPIDEELLDVWLKKSQRQLEGYLMELSKALGWQCNPDSPIDMQRAFQQLKLPIERTKGTITKPQGSPSFTDAILREIDHPTIKLARKAVKLASLRSKFLVNTKKVMSSGGILRFQLHQLRTAKDENSDAGEAGTVTGRFSSAAFIRDQEGCNIQQRMKAAKQRLAFGYDEDDSSHDDEIFVVRKLHIASKGRQVIASDMDQCQYRIFASYAGNEKVIQAYRDNPDMSFHKFMWDLIKPYADLSYRQQKDLDFAFLFGAGVTKMGLMMNHITAGEFDEIRRTKAYDHPKLEKTKEVKRIFEREVPEVKDLLELSMHLAKPECDRRCKRGDRLHQTLAHRGYVRTALGRRMRFPDGNRLHKAFNGVDQGTEADYMKTKLVEVREAVRSGNLDLILRITNHDEIVGDGDAENARKLDEILNVQSFDMLKVPLTWSTGIGPNWAETK